MELVMTPCVADKLSLPASLSQRLEDCVQCTAAAHCCQTARQQKPCGGSGSARTTARLSGESARATSVPVLTLGILPGCKTSCVVPPLWWTLLVHWLWLPISLLRVSLLWGVALLWRVALLWWVALLLLRVSCIVSHVTTKSAGTLHTGDTSMCV